jgi:hypothetical protein
MYISFLSRSPSNLTHITKDLFGIHLIPISASWKRIEKVRMKMMYDENVEERAKG